MVTELFAEMPILRGVLGAVAGVGFWVAGPIVAYYVWKRYRGDIHAGQE